MVPVRGDMLIFFGVCNLGFIYERPVEYFSTMNGFICDKCK